MKRRLHIHANTDVGGFDLITLVIYIEHRRRTFFTRRKGMRRARTELGIEFNILSPFPSTPGFPMDAPESAWIAFYNLFAKFIMTTSSHFFTLSLHFSF